MIGSWITGVLTAVIIGLGWTAYYQTLRLDEAQSDLALIRAELHTCGGRLDAVLRDVNSDNEIDNLDLLDFDIPPDWLRPVGPAGSAPADP
jgi:hypothetical protein